MRAFSLPIAAATAIIIAASGEAAEISSQQTLASRDILSARSSSCSWLTLWNCFTTTSSSSSSSKSSSSSSYSNSLASKSCYGSTGKPWDNTGKPGWCVGSSVDNVPTWDGGDSKWCSNSLYAKTSFCKKGNGYGQIPSKGSNKWGKQGGESGYPCPKKGGSKFGSKSTKTITSTTTQAVPTTVTVVSGTTLTTTESVTTTAVSTTTTTASGSTAIPTGPAAPTCDDGYQQIFTNYTKIADTGVYYGQLVGAAVIDNANYLTYGLSDDAEGCLAVCDNVAGCVFVNAYLDNQDDQDESERELLPQRQGQYTCALYSICETTDALTNYGGQSDPSYITDSSGWCKSSACSS